jgi:hypothetical protein
VVVAALLLDGGHLGRHPKRRADERLALAERVRYLGRDAKVGELDVPGVGEEDVCSLGMKERVVGKKKKENAKQLLSTAVNLT